jgi:probable addiction module antidote protein
MRTPKARPYIEDLDTDLRDPEYAAQYLNAAAEEGKAELLLALRDIARARGVAEVAELAGRGRESLYKALSEDGNPGVDTLLAVLSALDLKLHFQPA